MAVSGSLGTMVSIGARNPASRTRNGYEALATRTIDPTTLYNDIQDGLQAAAAAAIGATTISIDADGTATFTFAAGIYVGARFTIPNDTTEYRITSYTGKAADTAAAVSDVAITPALAVALADDGVITPIEVGDGLRIPTADNAFLVDLDPVTVSAVLGSLAVDTTYYVRKYPGDIIVLFATKGQAATGEAGTETSPGATLGTQTLSSSDWKLIGEAANVDEFGRTYQLVTSMSLADGAERKAKGSFNNGSFPLEINYDRFDPGQLVLRTAHRARTVYPFRVEYPEDVDGNAGEIIYFTGLVMQANPRIGGTNDIRMLRAQVEIDHHDPVEVAP